MLLSLAQIFLMGMIIGKVFETFRIPRLVGMLITGIVLGPYAMNMLDPKLLGISSELRQMALIIILMRAGLNLDIQDLRKVGRPAILLCFVPACFEIAGMLLLAPKLLGVSLLEAAIMGTVVAAVSPAVIVPRMLALMERGYGTSKSIPQMIMAGASVDDVFVIVLFTAFTGLAQSGEISALQFVKIPIAIFLGLLIGGLAGKVLSIVFTKFHIRDTGKVLILLSVSFLCVTFEHSSFNLIGFSGLLAVMAMGATLQIQKPVVSARLSGKFSKLWVGAEVLLFVLVGATVDIRYAWAAGGAVILLIFGGLLFRTVGVACSVARTGLSAKERLFTGISYLPKATVQAAIGGIPLSMGLACGHIVLTVAVVSILVTAPLGAMLIDSYYHNLLTKS